MGPTHLLCTVIKDLIAAPSTHWLLLETSKAEQLTFSYGMTRFPLMDRGREGKTYVYTTNLYQV